MIVKCFGLLATATLDSVIRQYIQCCVVVLKESPCPRGPIYKSLSWTTKSLKIFKDFAFCKLSVMYDHEDTVKNVLLTDVRYYLQICQQVSHFSL